jgi:hypothetical protein
VSCKRIVKNQHARAVDFACTFVLNNANIVALNATLNDLGMRVTDTIFSTVFVSFRVFCIDINVRIEERHTGVELFELDSL